VRTSDHGIETVPGWLSATLASDASDGMGVLPDWIRPLRPMSRLAGFVCTASIAEGDSLGIREAVERGPREGTILVAFGSPTSTKAVIGEVFGTWLWSRGFTALVTDGLARDTAQLRQLRLSVWCRGVTPIGSTRNGPGTTATAISTVESWVSPGDLLVSDDDGIVVWPRDRVTQLLVLARRRFERDEARLGRIRSGHPPDA
jgi:4-hydroxy-4-methyl-2-oxoglutarate aldolase